MQVTFIVTTTVVMLTVMQAIYCNGKMEFAVVYFCHQKATKFVERVHIKNMWRPLSLNSKLYTESFYVGYLSDGIDEPRNALKKL